jgi:hypothetical protein
MIGGFSRRSADEELRQTGRKVRDPGADMIRKHLAIATLASAAICAAAPAAQAQGLLDLGRVVLGLPTEEKEPIDYRERAPLVVPQNQQSLRAPTESRPADQRRANWPQDPDVIARRQAAEDARKPVSLDTFIGANPQPTRRLTNDEIRAGRVAGAEVPRAPQSLDTFLDPAGAGGPSNAYRGVTTINTLDRRNAETGLRPGELSRAEPKREFLTDPPSGLRRPSDAAAFRATREGQLGARQEASPYDIFRPQSNTR